MRFFEERNGQIVWEAEGDFQQSNVHKQVAISFRTPKYQSINVTQSAMVNIQLRRPSDGATSDALPFEYLPLDSGRRSFWCLQRELKKRSATTDIFQDLLNEHKPLSDQTNFNNQNNHPLHLNFEPNEIVVLDTPIDDSSKVIIDPQPEIIIEDHMTTADKTNDWLQHAEFVIDGNTFDSCINSDSNNNQVKHNTNDDDKTLNELLEQVAELDEIYTDHHIRRENLVIENELKKLEENIPKGVDQMDIDDNFDDTATYTSLQRAFKYPVHMSEGPPVPPRPSEIHTFNIQAPPIIINTVVDPNTLKRENREEEKLPPLPPKRAKKLPEISNGDKENKNFENEDLHVRRGSTRSLTPRPQSQIVIMKSTERLSPSTKKLPPKPVKANTNSNTLPKQKKPGFFTKLFSRKKSKPDINSNSSATDLNREDDAEFFDDSSLNHFTSDDPNRESIRSTRSLKPILTDNKKLGKPVARSVSSASGKRPNLTPDIIHIPLKGDSSNSLPLRSTGSGTHLSLPGNDTYERASTASLHPIDRKTMSALQLADVPLQDGNLGLIAIADAQSLKNLCEGEYGIKLDPSVDLTEAEHYALYTSLAPHATESEFDETSCYYAPVEAGEILTPAEIAKRLANNL